MEAKVVSIDIDESSIDDLYLHSRNNKLNITPLILSFDDLTKKIHGIPDDNNEFNSKESQVSPLFLPAVERLQSEIVLALGLVHHLTLGEGKEIDEVLSILSDLTNKVLILEFIELSDEKIQESPDFFKYIKNYSIENYNTELFLEAGKKYFKDVEILESYPSTRKLLVFKK